jgi:ribosomal protein L20A (L18A)
MMKDKELKTYLEDIREEMSEDVLAATNENIAKRLNSLMASHHKGKVSQVDLGRVLDKSPQSIGHILRCKQGLRLQDVVKLARFFHITADELLTGRKPVEKEDVNSKELEKLRATVARQKAAIVALTS